MISSSDLTDAKALDFTILGAISKTAGIDSFINPPDAQLKANMVFDVAVDALIDKTHTIGAWVQLTPPAAPEKEPDKEKKSRSRNFSSETQSPFALERLERRSLL